MEATDPSTCRKCGASHGGKCTGHSSRTGKACQRDPLRGSNVCSTHGAGAPQVKAKAERRLALMVTPALGVLERAMKGNREKENPGLAVRVAFDVLDRNNIGVPEKDKGAVFGLPSPSDLPPGTSVTLRVERLSDDEIQTMKRLLEKLGVSSLPPPAVIDVAVPS